MNLLTDKIHILRVETWLSRYEKCELKVVPANHFEWHNNVVNRSYGGNNVIADKLMYKVDEIYMFNTHL